MLRCNMCMQDLDSLFYFENATIDLCQITYRFLWLSFTGLIANCFCLLSLMYTVFISSAFVFFSRGTSSSLQCHKYSSYSTSTLKVNLVFAFVLPCSTALEMLFGFCYLSIYFTLESFFSRSYYKFQVIICFFCMSDFIFCFHVLLQGNF